MTSRTWVGVVLCLLAASSGRALAAPEPLHVPTREEREALRKSHLRLGRLAEPQTAGERAVAAAQDDVDILSYFLELEFLPTTRGVTGSVTITGQSLVPGFQHLVLDLMANMTVSSARRGTTALTFTRPGNLVDIVLDQSFDAGQTFTVKVTYSGVPDPTGLGSISWRKYPSSANGTAVSTLSEPDGAKTWWPSKDRPDDKAQVEMWWTVPSTWIATGNGKLIGTVTLTGNRKQYKWKPTDPLTTYLVMIAAAPYATFSHVYTPLAGGSMPIDYYVYPEDLTKAQESFKPTASMIAFFAQTFGEYPFVEDKYGMTEFPWGGAMEHTTNTSYGFALINGFHNYDSVIAHELSHQWWGDAVSPRTWSDIWLNEGFASYCEALWAEHVNGPAGYRNYMSSFWSSGFSGPVYNPWDLFGSTVYDKGAWVQHMLRRVVGDANFFNALRDWYAAHDNGAATTADYQATQEARYGGTLDWFFGQWVYQAGQPDYEWGWTTADLGDGTYRTYVRIRQIQTDAGPFAMPVDLNFSMLGGGTETHTVWNDQLDEDLTVVTTAWPTDVRFDENNWILKTAATVVPLADVDTDGVPDRDDNCLNAANPRQADFDLDGAGDACDPDDDNDGLADASDCAPFDAAQGAPGLVDRIDVTGAGHLAWNAAARATSHDVQRGTLSALSSGDYGVCLASGIVGTTLDDAEIPANADGFFYLVRGRDPGCGGGGSLGTDSNGAPRPAACP